MEWIIQHSTEIIAIFFAVIGVASIIAKLTPTKVDDKIVNAILGVINALALNPKKRGARD